MEILQILKLPRNQLRELPYQIYFLTFWNISLFYYDLSLCTELKAYWGYIPDAQTFPKDPAYPHHCCPLHWQEAVWLLLSPITTLWHIIYHDVPTPFSGKLRCPEYRVLPEIHTEQLASEWQLNATNIDNILLLLLLIRSLKHLRAIWEQRVWVCTRSQV